MLVFLDIHLFSLMDTQYIANLIVLVGYQRTSRSRTLNDKTVSSLGLDDPLEKGLKRTRRGESTILGIFYINAGIEHIEKRDHHLERCCVRGRSYQSQMVSDSDKARVPLHKAS